MLVRYIIYIFGIIIIFILGNFIADIVKTMWLVHAIIGALFGILGTIVMPSKKNLKYYHHILIIIAIAILFPLLFYFIEFTTGLHSIWQ